MRSRWNVAIAQTGARSVVADDAKTLRQATEETPKSRTLPIALDVTDPPRRAEDERPIVDHCIGDPGPVCVPNKSNDLHRRYRTSQGLSFNSHNHFIAFSSRAGRHPILSAESAQPPHPGYPLPMVISLELQTLDAIHEHGHDYDGLRRVGGDGVYQLAIFIFAVFGIAASIKYLRS